MLEVDEIREYIELFMTTSVWVWTVRLASFYNQL